ncbi:unnamed protein product [Prorocentrum cordatum]|uniref:CSD domain-containing protein n=1 Tax=Prorocentrum cordatum TaxID=2364126 RepID=A0ABN9TFW9_9DINO|nr:unnamed protein product [Polarella glacialis]
MAAETCVGTIKALDADVGWGSIECAQTRPLYDRDVLFQAADLQGRQVSGGEIVTFQVTNVSGSPVAVNLQFLQQEGPAAPAAPRPPPPPPPPPVLAPHATQPAQAAAAPGLAGGQGALLLGQGASYVGSVKNYNPVKGWGFIECPETGQVLGKDIFFLKSELSGEFQASRGDVVSFQITQGKNGPMAQSVVYLNSAASAAPQGSGLYSGILKTYNQEREGVGLHRVRRYQGAVRQGHLRDVLGIQGAPGGHRPVLDLLGGPGGKKGPIASDVQVIGADGLAVEAPGGRAAERLCGVVGSWDEVQGTGLITGEGVTSKFAEDVPFFRDALGGKPIFTGDQVRFAFTMGDQGPVAHEVEALPSGSVVSNGCPGQLYTGHVKSYGADKGWGFVASDETTRLFGKDIFVHRREIPEGICPERGQQVCFSVRLSATGRPEATTVSFPGAAAGLAGPGAPELALLQLAGLAAAPAAAAAGARPPPPPEP